MENTEVKAKDRTINYGEMFAGVAVLCGIFYGMKRKKDFIGTGVYAIAFGIAGGFIGNAINKYQTLNSN